MFDKLFKYCNVIYFKDVTYFKDCVKNLKGKVVISDSKDIVDICNVYGIMCVLNLNQYNIPHDKIDCIVSGKVDTSLESTIIKKDLKIPVIYLEDLKKWCGVCYSYNIVDSENSTGKYCSDNCMQVHGGFTKNFKHEVIEDLEIKTVLGKYYEKPVTVVSDRVTKNISSKFQRSMEKDAIRLEYAFKREEYKKEMRQPSLRKASISDKKKKVDETLHEKNESSKTCKGITKKGEKCTNRSLSSSGYCGILSHSINAQTKD